MVEPETSDDKLAAYARALADAVEAALPGWVTRSVARRLGDAGMVDELEVAGVAGVADVAEVAEVADATATLARNEVMPRIRALLGTDIDHQWTTPLALLRAAVAYPTSVLRGAGVAPVARDPFAERAFPDDVYDHAPASFADIDPSLQEPGLAWGAAKAHVHLARRRAAPSPPEDR